MAPAFYATSFLPAERVLFIPQFVLVVTIMSCGLLDGLAAPPLVTMWRTERSSLKRVLLTAGLSFVLLVPLGTAARTVFEANDLRVYAAELDDRDRQAREAQAAGAASLTVAEIDQPAMIALTEPGADPTQWANVCIARYYNLDTLTTTSTGA